MNNYLEFCIQVNKYEDFVYRCFKEHTKGWKGYPGIESIDFAPEQINICYSVYDDKDALDIPANFVENDDVTGVVTLWREDAERIRLERLDKETKEQEARERAEFNRLSAKYSGVIENEQYKSKKI